MQEAPKIQALKTDEVFVYSYRIYVKNLKTIILYCLLILAPLNLFQFFISPKDISFYGQDSTVSLSIVFDSILNSATAPGMILLILSSALAFIPIAGLIWASAETLRGSIPSFAETLKPALKYFIPMAIMFGVYLFLWLLGMVLLVLPGLFFLVYFSFYFAAMVLDHKGWFGSFKASYEVSRPNFWALLVFWILWTLIYLAFSVVFQMVIQQFAEEIIPYMIFYFIHNALLLYLVIPGTVYYISLRDVKLAKEAAGQAGPPEKWYGLP